jgi:2,5-diamino-6-(ribosylamino)-4(3H)-pyrimidinone 5'-phosphate reductase
MMGKTCGISIVATISAVLRPYISTNLAISADGKISSSPPRPSGWTSAADHARLLKLRQNADAILVGRGTLETDKMTLTVPGKSTQPLRCIISRSGRIDPQHPIFQKAGGDIHLLVTADSQEKTDPRVTAHRSTLREFLENLAKNFHIQNLHCEGGGQLIRALAEIDAIDEFHLTLAGHTIFGGEEASTATGIAADFLPNSLKFQLSHFEPSPETGECFLTYQRDR